LALTDFIADCAFVVERFSENGINTLSICALTFMIIPIVVNLVLVCSLLQSEFATEEVTTDFTVHHYLFKLIVDQ